jgi:hypothetical protein
MRVARAAGVSRSGNLVTCLCSVSNYLFAPPCFDKNSDFALILSQTT